MQISSSLVEMVNKSNQFQEDYKKLNKQERVLVGSLVIGIESPYQEIFNASFMGEGANVANLLETLFTIFRTNPKEVPPPQTSNIRPVFDLPNKKKFN